MRKLLNQELNRKTVEEFQISEKFPIVVVLDNVRSLHNVGSVFRTGDAFLVSEILLCGITGKPPHAEIHKTALGATETVRWQHFEKTEYAIQYLREKQFKIFCLEQAEQSTFLQNFEPQKEGKYAFVFGHEIRGVDQQIINLSDGCIEIPQFGTKHSFNLSVSAGILLWDYYAKMDKFGASVK